jgi:enoyl-CoA hydratase/carnithine racemase
MGDTVLYEAADRVATLTLNRPQPLNAVTAQLIDDFRAARARARSDAEARARSDAEARARSDGEARVRKGGRAFCAGYEIASGAAALCAGEGNTPWDPVAD